MISGQKCWLKAKLLAVKFGNPTLLFFITMYKNEINTSFFNVKCTNKCGVLVYSIQFMCSDIYIITVTVNLPNLIPN